jgi:hypothetical protein
MDIRAHAIELLNEFYLCMRARPKHNAVDFRLEKDQCEMVANNLNNLLAWGTEEEIAESCKILEPKLIKLKEKLTFELLKYGV